MTTIHLAGGEVSRLTKALMDNGCKHVLFSFFFIHTMKLHAHIAKTQAEHPEVTYILDSGAFSYFSQIERGKKLMEWRDYKREYFAYIAETWTRWEPSSRLRWMRLQVAAAQDHTPPPGMPTAGTAATEGDWAEEVAMAWLFSRRADEIDHIGLAAEFRRIAVEAERRGEVKGLRWADKYLRDFGFTNVALFLRQQADRLEREGKGGK